MVGHYLTAALRGVRARPLSAAIKLLALALGFACFLTANMIADYVGRADTQWRNAGRIYTLSQTSRLAGAEETIEGTVGSISGGAVEALRAEFPELGIAATQTASMTLEANGLRVEHNILGVDPDFLRIFDLPMLAGGGEDSLDAPNTALIDAQTATQLFGTTDVVGRTLTVRDWDLTVAGVFAMPRPSHLGEGGTGKDVRLIVSRETGRMVQGFALQDGVRQPSPTPTGWNNTCCTTYLLLPEDGSLTPSRLQERLDDFSARRVPPEFDEIRFTPTSMGDVAKAYMNLGLFGGSLDLSLLTILNVFAALILAVACLDFANLATAEAAARAREVGLRRTVGATRLQVVIQTMVEAGLLTVVALLLVLPITMLIVGPLGRAIRLDIGLPGPGYWPGVLAVAIAVCLAAGAYPALVLSRIRPIGALRMAGTRGGAGAVRVALIVAQFAAASFLLAAVSVMMAQKAELRSRVSDPALDPRVVITVGRSDLGGNSGVDPETLRAELLSHPAVTGYASSPNQPFQRATTTGGQAPTFSKTEDPGASPLSTQLRMVSYDYLDVAGIPLLAGRDFSAEDDGLGGSRFTFTPDGDPQINPDAPPAAVIVDEATAALLDLTPQAAIGEVFYQFQQIMFVGGPAGATNTEPRTLSIALPVVIVGVAANAPLEYMVEGPSNYLYMLGAGGAGSTNIILRVSRADVAGALAHIDSVWAEFFPGRQIDRVFLDEAFDANFAMFNLLNVVFLALSAIAIAIAAMGLFGIASFVVQRRLREVGVRKTLGASSARVLGLMLWDFSKPVLLANLVAWPLAWLAARTYLNLFVTRIDLTPAPFLFALLTTLLIAWLAVGAHALRAARVKPALVLKTE